MSTVIELVGQELEDKRGLRVYQVHDVSDAATAWGLVNALAPATWNNLIKQTVHVHELGGDVWEGEVPYSVLERPEEGSIGWSFEIGTQTLHITQVKLDHHIKDYAASGDAPNHKGTIGVRDDGGQGADGCDILVPYFKWSETHYFPASTVATHSWIQTHEELVGTVNQDPFRVWDKGELLLLSVTGSKQAEPDVPITYTFAASRSETGEKYGDITGVDKEGHQYIWFEYWSEEDMTAKDLIYPVKAVHIEQIYEYGDWQNDLPLPDPWS